MILFFSFFQNVVLFFTYVVVHAILNFLLLLCIFVFSYMCLITFIYADIPTSMDLEPL